MFSSRYELSYYLILSSFILMSGCSSEPAASTSNKMSQSESSTEKSLAEKSSAENTKAESNTAPEPVQIDAITAKEYFEACEKAPEAALKKYEGKPIRLTGKLKSLHSGFTGELSFRLDASEDPEQWMSLESPDVSVSLGDHEKNPESRLALGQEITVEGVGKKSMTSTAALENCRIVEIKGDFKPEFLSADELEKEFSTNREATDNKWGMKYFYLTGNIKHLNRENGQIELGNDQKKTALLKTDDHFELEHLKPGQKLQVLGVYWKFRDQEQVPEIIDFFLISPQRPKANIEPTKMADSVPHFTADRLAEAFESDPRRFVRRYQKEPRLIQIEGTIDTIEKDLLGWDMQIKNALKHDINCSFPTLTKTEAAALKPGDHVTIRGKLFIKTRWFGKAEPISLMNCKIVP